MCSRNMSKTKNNKRNNEEHSSFSSSSSSLSSDEEEIDARDLKPIKDYLSNRKEMARQLFKSVKQEKIRMMLPQILKQMDLNELEEWCVSELSGMSKARIIGILNGKPMLGSSDTSESDDSGPSLEIISDTEEWPTDDDIIKTENGAKGKLKKDKTKVKRKAQNNKKNDSAKSDVKAKCNIKNENTTKDVKIKKEDDKEKRKEGDSLLDLLELEMRARAIRALIRKEEDVIPSSNQPQTNNSQTMENNIKTLQDDAKAKENCRKQLERIISGHQVSKGEDEDVVLVVQPTPVVELLSSDEEEASESRVNQKLDNERATETSKSTGNCNENVKNPTKISSQGSKEEKRLQEVVETHGNTSKTDSSIRSEAQTIMPERNVDIKNNTLSISISADHVAEKRKKSKKRSHSKSQSISSSNENILKPINTETIDNETEQTNDEHIDEQSRVSSSENAAEEENKTAEKDKNKEEKFTDLDEIIDLDDYCDVVMGIENCDEDKSQDNIIAPQEENKEPVPQTSQSKSDSETWASRYYQTDDVQSVIKESKIQSEIRKRLRERQRLSKLNKSPNLNTPSQSSATDSTATSKKIPTGSVEEYLALKRTVNANISDDNSNNNSNLDSNMQDNSNLDSNTMQDNSAIVAPDSDVNTKEIPVQDENISSDRECTDSDSQNANVSETVTSEPVEVIADTKDNIQSV